MIILFEYEIVEYYTLHCSLKRKARSVRPRTAIDVPAHKGEFS